MGPQRRYYTNTLRVWEENIKENIWAK